MSAEFKESLMRPALFSAAVLALSALAAPAMAQTAETAGQAAGGVLFDFCMPLFGPGPMHADRLSATATMANLTAAPTGARPVGLDAAQLSLQAPSPPDSMVLVFWVADPGICQILVLGSAGAGGDLIAAMPQLGWTAQQQAVPTGPDTAADVFIGQPRGYDSALLVVANKWVSDAEPEGSVRLIMNVMRSQ